MSERPKSILERLLKPFRGDTSRRMLAAAVLSITTALLVVDFSTHRYPDYQEGDVAELDLIAQEAFTYQDPEELLQRRAMFLSQKVGFKFGRYAIHQLQKIERHHRWLTTDPPNAPKPEDFGAVPGENSPKFPDTASENAFRAAVKHHRAYKAWRKNRNPKRAALEEKYGYDTKHAMHLCRLLKMGCEILEEGEVVMAVILLSQNLQS